MRLPAQAGEFASIYQDIAHWNFPTTVVQADEIWAFVEVKQRRAVRRGDGGLFDLHRD